MTEEQILVLESYGYKMVCENCKKEFEELYSKTQYNNNTDTRYLCLECYKEVHREDFHGDS